MAVSTKSVLTPQQKLQAIKRYEQGVPIADLSKELRVHEQTIYGWIRRTGSTGGRVISGLRSKIAATVEKIEALQGELKKLRRAESALKGK